jgi:hypothetical protein
MPTVFSCQELKKHPAFMTEYDASKPMSPALEGLQALMYQSDSNDGRMALALNSLKNHVTTIIVTWLAKISENNTVTGLDCNLLRVGFWYKNVL